MRDAVHVAVAPVKAKLPLQPGERVMLNPQGEAVPAWGKDQWIGNVDPFLNGMVHPGQTFWLFMRPGTTSQVRHSWTSPAFAPKLPIKETP
jgi:hypothetical protein